MGGDGGGTNEQTTTADSCPGLFKTWRGRPRLPEACAHALHASMHMISATIQSYDARGGKGRKTWMWMSARCRHAGRTQCLSSVDQVEMS
eukprot:9261890-Pyramimonas_sp.AAC.1